MAGFAARKETARGVALPLHAKALALEHEGRGPAVIVTADVLGLTARITDAVASAVHRQAGIARADLLFNASHTHCGPVVDEQLSVAYDLSPAQWDGIREYSARLEGLLSGVIQQALSRLAPARIGFARGEAAFAANRRVQFSPDGPVDHSVPVLRVDAPDGAPLAILFGYACHNTTLPATFVEYHGDYAGVAQAALEARHRGTVAMYMAGCGADANPRPRGTVEHVRAHGAALADAVDRALETATPIEAGLRTAYGSAELRFVGDADRERWLETLKVEPVYLERYAAVMAGMAARPGGLPESQDCPVQVWRLGPGLTLVALGGEVVVDYALRLRREYPAGPLWAAGYSNDVFGYLPSERVRREGGYEGADAMIYYARPAPFAEGVEESVFAEVRRLMSRVGPAA
jgi:neutral ceramidase